MTPLAEILLRQIAATGPITVADYMSACLMHPEHGLYTTRDPLGAHGDFVTAPEVSQMFGELLGLALAQSWLDQGAPAPFTLAELGPGRGTLMADALRATRGVPGFHAALRLWLVELPGPLRQAQKHRLAAHAPRWADSLMDLPEAPTFLIANEYFDAMPIRQFLRDGAGWRERLVSAKGGALAFGLGPATPLAALDVRLGDTQDGDMVETCAPTVAQAGEIGRRIAAHGGAALIVDYGDWQSIGDTLQALRHHRKTGPLDAPGDSDLTAHVAFAGLAGAAKAAGAAATPLTTQGALLDRLGIAQRARALAAAAREGAEAVAAAHRRLTHPAEMGHLFKGLAIHPVHAPPPPGFA